MTIERKLLSTSPSGGATDVAEVFSTHLYTGNNTTNVINNGIDLAGEGGMVWLKSRSAAASGSIFDTIRGRAYNFQTAEASFADTFAANAGVTSFNSNGFSLGVGSYGSTNGNNVTYASWTFRKKEKFFDIVTYTGNGSARTISHGLNGPVGMILIKRISGTGNSNWETFHRGQGPTKSGRLNNNTAFSNNASGGYWNSTAPTNSVFSIGTDGGVNSNGQTYIAYLFADNSSEDAEDQMIKCGSYTGTGSNLDVNLGWEPQFLLIKNSTSAADWYILDTMRGFTATTLSNELVNPNSANAESKVGNVVYDQYLTSTGFRMLANASEFNTNGQTYIFMSIRAPLMVEPEAATDVFAIDTRGSSAATADGVVYHSNFPVDMTLARNIGSGGSMLAYNRSRADRGVFTNTTAADSSQGGHKWDSMHGFDVRTLSASTAQYAWMWKRAKGFMDVINYIGTGSARTLPHSLGVVPEMMWVRNLTTADSWQVYAAPLGNTKYIYLNENYFAGTNISRWNNTTPTASVITVGSTDGVNRNTDRHTAYLFATLAGISKCGSYTGNGSYQTISCGFSAGSRFVLIKRTNGTNPAGDWYFWDSVRGISAGNDPHLSLNTNAGQVTNDDSIDPANSGFIVNQVSATNINVSSGTYIFYAIA